jgi:hypothetical protein
METTKLHIPKMTTFTFQGVEYNEERLVAAGAECPTTLIAMDSLIDSEETRTTGNATGPILVIKQADGFHVVLRSSAPYTEKTKCRILSKFALKKARADNVYEDAAAAMADRLRRPFTRRY